MNAGVALLALGLVGGGLYWASKAKADEQPSPEPEFQDFEVTGDSGMHYLVTTTEHRQDSVGHIVVNVVQDSTGQPILVYQQYVGDNSTRILDMNATVQMSKYGLQSTVTAAAIEDFGIFVTNQ